MPSPLSGSGAASPDRLRPGVLLARSESRSPSEAQSPAASAPDPARQAAGEDSLTLSVSVRMRARLEGLRQAAENLKTGNQLLSVADNALGSMQEHVLRIRQLAVKASHGALTGLDRQNLQVEVSQLIDEVDRIASQTEFNHLRLLQGDYARGSRTASLWFQVGANGLERERIYISTNSARSLNLERADNALLSVSTPEIANDAIRTVDSALERLVKERSSMNAYLRRFREVGELTAREIQALESSGETPLTYAPR
jgi:flagellin